MGLVTQARRERLEERGIVVRRETKRKNAGGMEEGGDDEEGPLIRIKTKRENRGRGGSVNMSSHH